MNIGNTSVSANVYDSDDCLTLKTVRIEFMAWEDVIDVGGGWRGNPFTIDFTTLVEMGNIEGIQSLFIQSPFPEGMSLFVQGTGQLIDLGVTRMNEIIPIFSPSPPVFEIRISPQLFETSPEDWMQISPEQGRFQYWPKLLFTNRKVYAR